MTTDLFIHLQNLKILTDFRNSKLDTIQLFWDYIEKGNNPQKIHDKSITYGCLDDMYDPSEEDLEKAKESLERAKQTDFIFLYKEMVRNNIEKNLDYDKVILPDALEINLIYEEIIKPNVNLANYMATNEKISTEYVTLAKNLLPNDFFKESNLLQDNEKLSNTKPILSSQIGSGLKNLITHSKSDEIVEKIKIQYKNIKGKRLKLLLIALQQSNLLPKDRIASKFHRCCKNEFGWDIASYPAMNDYNFNEFTDEDELTQMKEFLKRILNDLA